MLIGKITKNVAYEFGYNKMISSDLLITFGFSLRTSGNHKGMFIHFYIRQHGFECNIYSVHHEGYECRICK